MRRILCIIIFVAALFFVLPFALAASIVKDVKEGNRLYEDEKYDEAISKYNEARTESPDSDIVNFNVGATLYKQGDYPKAVDSLIKSLVTKDSQLESMANYNIGNSIVRQGLIKENTDSSGALNLYKKALSYYKRAVDLDEKDEDAKFNYEFVEKKIKELMQQQQQQQQQQQEKEKQDKEEQKQEKEKQEQEEEKQKKEQQEEQKEKEEQEQKEKEQEGKEKEQKEQEQKEKEQREQEEKEKEKQEQEQKKEQPQPSPGQTPQGAPQGSGEEFGGEGEAEEIPAELGEMSEEEARMLLESYQHEEDAKDTKAKKKKAGYPRVLRDW